MLVVGMETLGYKRQINLGWGDTSVCQSMWRPEFKSPAHTQSHLHMTAGTCNPVLAEKSGPWKLEGYPESVRDTTKGARG